MPRATHHIRSHPTQMQRAPQRGFVLVVVILAILAVLATVVVVGIAGSVGNTEQRNAREQEGLAILNKAKASLLGYAIQVADGGAGGFRMGGLPNPDAVDTGGMTIQYDGRADSRCLTNTATGFPTISNLIGDQNKRCIGKLPWKDLGVDIGIVDAQDPNGLVPWYVVSPNLLRFDPCLSILNSEVSSLSYSGYACPSYPALPSTLPYPWFTVRDGTGQVLSDRVAAVLILPGSPIQTEIRGQNRSAASPGSRLDYLDAVKIPLGCSASCTSTIDNADMTGQFVALRPGTSYPTNAEVTTLRGSPVPFNDLVIYVTVDEVIERLEQRVLSEMQRALTDYKSKNGTAYPWPASFSKPLGYNQFLSQPPPSTAAFGFFPFLVQPEASAPPLPYAQYPNYATTFDWTIRNTGTTSTNCVAAPSGGFFDTRDALAIGSTQSSGGTCTWKGTGGVSCDYTSPASSAISYSFNRYSTAARCRSKTVAPIGTDALSVTISSIQLTVAPTCSAANLTYAKGSASEYGTWSWACANSANQFDVLGTYSIPSLGTSETNISILGVGKQVSINKMRYQPIMPYWYYFNEWYKLGFLGVAPSLAPTNVMPCGATNFLTVDQVSSVPAVVLLAGAKFPPLPAASTQTRPPLGGTNLNDYLESANLNAATNCTFSSPKSRPGETNDRALSVQP
jgi:type II secretory pathway pseudopilin PulG